MIVFSCGRDNVDAAKAHIESLKMQTYQDFTHIIVDDASENPSLFRFLRTLKSERVVVHKNLDRSFWLKNATNLLFERISDLEIVVVIDLDDTLLHENVLANIATLYEQHPDIYLTFGSYVQSDELNKGIKRKYPSVGDVKKTLGSSNIRKAPWVFTHLQTFRGFLFNDLNPSTDFVDIDGQWLKSSYDRALIYPMVELAGKEHIYFLKEAVYTYNVNNEFSVFRVNPDQQRKNKQWIINGLKHYDRKDFCHLL